MNIIQKILTTLLISAVVSVPILGSVCNTEVKATEKDTSSSVQLGNDVVQLSFVNYKGNEAQPKQGADTFDPSTNTRRVRLAVSTLVRFSRPANAVASDTYRYFYSDPEHTDGFYLSGFSKSAELSLKPSKPGIYTVIAESRTSSGIKSCKYIFDYRESPQKCTFTDDFGVGDNITMYLEDPFILEMKKGSFCYTVSSDTIVFTASRISSNLLSLNPKKTGKSSLFVITRSGMIKTFNVTVKNKPLVDLDSLKEKTYNTYMNCTLTLPHVNGMTYRSSDTSKVTVSDKGVITGKAVGSANVKVSYDGSSVTLPVTVSSSFYLKTTWKSINVGSTFSIVPVSSTDKSKTYTYSSGDKSIATVSSSGVIKGIKPGAVQITVKNNLGEKKIFKAFVNTTSVKISDKELILKVGESRTLTAKLDPGSVTQYHFVSNNINVVSVSTSGALKAVSLGTTTVYVKTNNGLTDSCKVTVTDLPDSTTVKYGSNIPTVHVGKTVKFSINASDTKYNSLIKVRTSNSKVVTVSYSNGVCTVKGVGTGKAYVTATLPNGKQNSGMVYCIGNYNDYRTNYVVEKGIDLSCFNSKVDFNALKNDGFSYVIIRAGFGNHISQKDSMFETHIKGAIDAGLGIGIYYFSYAVDTADAKKEAEICNKIISKYRKYITHGVYFDYEDDSISYATRNYYTVNKKNVTNITAAFCSEIERYGYVAGVYQNRSYTEQYLDLSKLSDYLFWYAAPETNTFPFDMDMWQYTFTAHPKGTQGDTDGDKLFTTIFEVLKKL